MPEEITEPEVLTIEQAQENALAITQQHPIIAIIDQDTHTCVSNSFLAIKRARKLLNQMLDPGIKSWHKGHKDAITHKKFYDDPLKALESAHCKALGDFDAEQERLARVKRQADEAAARKVIEDAARAEAEAKRQETAQAVAELGRPDIAEEIAAEPVVVAPVTEAVYVEPAPEPIKTKGVNSRPTYKCNVVDKAKLLQAVLMGKASPDCFIPDQSYLNKRAGEEKDAFKLAGCELVTGRSVSGRTA